jgi:hypothetical protein
LPAAAVPVDPALVVVVRTRRVLLLRPAACCGKVGAKSPKPTVVTDTITKKRESV